MRRRRGRRRRPSHEKAGRPWKEKFREIAYHERCRENDLSLEAFRDFRRKKGHKV